MKRILYWFRNDLRLHDNEGFSRAVQKADEVLPVFVFDPRLFNEIPDLCFRKTGVFRANFLIESVADLRRNLRNRGGHLIIRVGDPAKILTELARETRASAIYASKEVTSEETDIESSLSRLLKPHAIGLELFWQSTLYHVRDLPFEIARLPDVFSQFRNQVERRAKIRSTFDDPVRVNLVPGIDPGDMPDLTTFGFLAERIEAANQPDVRRAVPFRGGETVALQRLEQYLWGRDLIKTYKETRNGLLGEDYSSKFSAWLAHGCLSPRLIYEEVLRYEDERVKNDSTYWLIFELIWRDFFRFVALRFGDRIFKPSGIKHDLSKRWRHDQNLFIKWTEGQTGIPFIDANMRELVATGFMSNRGRQNVGSFLVKDLGIDWTWGAAWFESLLVDYDPCSNWGNWNYTAGVGNDPREDRYFNIYSQATRYDEKGQYVKHWLPELIGVPAPQVHLVSNLPRREQELYGLALGHTYPMPLINPNKWLKK
jgi:deoxyribodipyrimidine photo-lyase